MIDLKAKSVEVAKEPLPEWFQKLSEDQQQKYLDEHKDSKLYKQLKKEQKRNDALVKVQKEKVDHSVQPEHEKKIADHNAGGPSPTNFRGPKDKKGSAFNRPEDERKIVRIVTEISRLADLYRQKGKDFPDFDLCEISIPGTNLFCGVNKNVPRKHMPQLKAKALPGSWAAKNLEADDKGEVNGEKEFVNYLQKKGVSVSDAKIPATELKSTQNQLVGQKVAGMYEALKKDPNIKGIRAPIFVSKDGYVLDGHHRWAAVVCYDMADGIGKSVEMDVRVIDMEIGDLLDETNKFCKEVGLETKDAKAEASVVTAKIWNEERGCYVGLDGKTKVCDNAPTQTASTETIIELGAPKKSVIDLVRK